MVEPWKPAIQVWPFADAPEELRVLSPFGGSEETIIYVPPKMCALFSDEDWVSAMPPAFWFLANEPKMNGQVQAASGNIGLYSLHLLPNGGRVAITAESEKDDFGVMSAW